MESLIRSVWPTAELKLFGSSVNLLCDLHSDCDLSLIMPPATLVKQSCYNVSDNPHLTIPLTVLCPMMADLTHLPLCCSACQTFKPRPKDQGRKDGGKFKEKKKEPEVEQGQPERKELHTEPSPPGEQLTAPTTPGLTPSPTVKASPALSADALPTLDLSNPSDLASLTLTPAPGDEWIEPGVVVEKLAALLKTDASYSSILALPKARVPIVKLTAQRHGFDLDIGVNNLLALENSALLKAYMACDVRARQLTYVIKFWAKQRKINDPFRGTLSSYAYVLMTIHYLQQLSPPVLPCLQSYASPNRPTRIVSGYDVHFAPASAWSSHNRYSLSQLFSGWLFYYAHSFGYSDDVISIRVGGVLAKRAKEREWASSGKRDRHLLSIEDPFEVSHDVGRVCDATALYEIRGECIRGIRMMTDGKGIRELTAKYEKEWRGS